MKKIRVRFTETSASDKVYEKQKIAAQELKEAYVLKSGIYSTEDGPWKVLKEGKTPPSDKESFIPKDAIIVKQRGVFAYGDVPYKVLVNGKRKFQASFTPKNIAQLQKAGALTVTEVPEKVKPEITVKVNNKTQGMSKAKSKLDKLIDLLNTSVPSTKTLQMWSKILDKTKTEDKKLEKDLDFLLTKYIDSLKVSKKQFNALSSIFKELQG